MGWDSYIHLTKPGSPGEPFLDTADSTNKDQGRTQAEELKNQNSIAKGSQNWTAANKIVQTYKLNINRGNPC